MRESSHELHKRSTARGAPAVKKSAWAWYSKRDFGVCPMWCNGTMPTRSQLEANVDQSLWMDPSPVQLGALLPHHGCSVCSPMHSPEIPFGFCAAPNARNTLPAWRETTIKVMNDGALLRHKEQSVFYFLTGGYVIPVVIFNCLLPGCSRGTGRARLKLSGN